MTLRAFFTLVTAAFLVPRFAVAQTQRAAPDRSPADERANRLSHTVVRLAILGAYRSLYDLYVFAPGAEASLGREGEWAGGLVNVYGLHGSTVAGLPVTQFGITGTFEAHFGGLRVGAGGGLTNFSIVRATNGQRLSSTGFENVVRLGYDFSDHGPYILSQFSVAFYKGGPDFAIVSGPTLYVGWRF